jgi:4-alpha-glucanotransferase
MNSERHVSLGLVFHNHQPVGQSDEVFEENYERCYHPLVAALERHPTVRCGLHYTGSLLDWFIVHKPEYLRLIRALVARGQVEVLSGGYYEPILPSIPDDDKRGQIVKLSKAVQREFGYHPTGMWLAERVWEPTLPTHLAAAGIEYTIVDDSHFKMVGLEDKDLNGYFVTEDVGHTVNVFATSKQLRYTIPWRPVEETIEFLRSEAVPYTGKIFAMGDDGEKFGAWPDTYEHSWGHDGRSGWVDAFFTALEQNVAWLHTVRLADHIRDHAAVGRVYLPTASYMEMMQWALPAEQSHEYGVLYHRLEEADDPVVRFMKGGFWRNFMVKYPEINAQHKKMLRVHDLIMQARRATRDGRAAVAQPHAVLEEAQEDLWRGQSNDTYWHGLFGGIYMTDVRVRLQAHLLRAEQAAERVLYGEGNWLKQEITDFDRDSMHELLIEGNALNLYIDLGEGGSIFEWDLRPHNFNLASTMSRRPESYHTTLREVEERRRAEQHPQEQGIGAGPVALHEAIRVKETGLDRYLGYDRYRRNCMIDHFLGPGTTLETFHEGTYNEEGDFVDGVYQAEMEQNGSAYHVILERDGHVRTETGRKPVRVSKRLIMRAGTPNFRVVYTIQNIGDSELTAVFGSEWNINLLGGGHNPSAYYKVEGVELEDAALDSTGEARDVTELAMGNSWLEIELGLRLNHEATLWRFPIETVSGSEAGFERNYQGSCILLHWLLKLGAGESIDIELTWINQGVTRKPEDEWIGD